MTPTPSTPAPAAPRAAGREVTPDDVKSWARIVGDVDDAILVEVCAGITAWVERLPVVADDVAAGDPWPPEVHLGATMVAARYYRRRLSPAGVDQVTDAGAVYVARADPDTARLLGLDRLARPRVG